MYLLLGKLKQSFMTLIKFLNKPQFLQTTTNLNYDIDDAIKRCLITT